MNAVKDLLKSGKTVIGTGGPPNPDLAAILADSGFDFLLFDTQHSPIEIHQLIPAIQATNGKKAAPIVRVSDNRPDLICFALDAGARGIVVPMVNTREEAEAMVDSCRYYPLGSRSNSGVRGEWGETKDYRDYLDTANEGMVIAPMKPIIASVTNSSTVVNPALYRRNCIMVSTPNGAGYFGASSHPRLESQLLGSSPPPLNSLSTAYSRWIMT